MGSGTGRTPALSIAAMGRTYTLKPGGGAKKERTTGMFPGETRQTPASRKNNV